MGAGAGVGGEAAVEGSTGRSGGRARRRMTQRAVVEAHGPSAFFRLILFR